MYTHIVEFNKPQNVDDVVDLILIANGFDPSKSATVMTFSDGRFPQIEYAVYAFPTSQQRVGIENAYMDGASLDFRPHNAEPDTIKQEYCGQTDRFQAYLLQIPDPKIALQKAKKAIEEMGGILKDAA